MSMRKHPILRFTYGEVNCQHSYDIAKVVTNIKSFDFSTLNTTIPHQKL